MHSTRILIALASLLALRPAHGQAQPPLSERPAITVTAFEFGTIATQAAGDVRGRRGRPDVAYPDPLQHSGLAEALGTGVADLVVEKLVESDRFRVFERRQMDAVVREQQLDTVEGDGMGRARYVVTGSISRLGLNGRDVGGIGGGFGRGRLLGGLGGLGVKYSSTIIQVTVRVVDTRTGEIIGSFTSEGKSNRRWGVTAFGLGSGGFGGTKVQDTNFRETAVGEAATRAAAEIAERVVAMRAWRLRP